MALNDELQAVWDAYISAYRTGDARGCAAVFSATGLLMSPYGPTARGREEIAAAHEEWTSEGGENKELEVVEFGGTDDLAWCLVRFSEGSVSAVGTSLNVFERHPDGRWLIKLCCMTQSTAPLA